MNTLRRCPELAVLAGLLVVLNLHVLPGVQWEPLVFLPDRAADGEWWRFFTHAFVHVTWYHLFLDGVAFLILYGMLDAKRAAIRIGYAFSSIAGSLGLALLLSPHIHELGLCGLSGAAHGLMAISALEMIRRRSEDPQLALLGGAALGLVLAKGLWELVTGRVVFEFLQFGMTGTPVAVSHLGGIAGGLGAFALARALASAGRRGRAALPAA